VLAPDARVLLLDQLRPPQGYRLDAAVATTFTLGLEAALVPPLAFAAAGLRTAADPLSITAAVRQCTDRVDVFCQAGMVKVPAVASDLFAFLEPMVHEVAAPPGGLFHPKLWLLRFAADGLQDLYRLLVLSRNLTNDHAWDVTLRLDAVRQAQPMASNAPLAALLRRLPATVTVPMPDERRSRVLALAEDARRLVWDLPDEVDALTFHVFGVPGQRPAPDFSGRRHLVVSPFLEAGGLEQVSRSGRDTTVVSRAESFDALPPTALAGPLSPFLLSAVSPAAESEDDGVEPEELPPPALLDGLHAKLYVVERGWRSHVFVGSANATDAAFSRNVELLVEMEAKASRLGIAAFLSSEGGLGALLEPYDAVGGAAPDPRDEDRYRLEEALRRLATQQWVASVSGDDGVHDLEVTSDRELRLEPATSAQVELLTRRGTAEALLDGHTASVAFDDVPLAEVTPFLVITLRGVGGLEVTGVVKAALVDDPEGRLDAVLAAQVDTPEKFLRLLALLLGLADGHLLALLAATSAAGSGSAARVGPAPGVFESLVRALALRPAALADLDGLVERLQRTEQGLAVLPPGFLDLWSVVQATRSALAKEHS